MEDDVVRFYVPFDERDDAKRLGARWDKEMRRWYVKAGTDLRPFERWIDPPVDYLPEVPLDSPRITADIHPDGSLRAIRSRLLQEEWIELRRKVSKDAGYRCEACGRRGKDHPVETHDIWTFDSETGVQTLVCVKAFCPECHRVRHLNEEIRDDFELPRFQELVSWTSLVNGWSRKDAERHLRDCDDKRAALLGRKWTVHASAILDYFEDLSAESRERLGLPQASESRW